jgi:hypothetical protein
MRCENRIIDPWWAPDAHRSWKAAETEVIENGWLAGKDLVII